MPTRPLIDASEEMDIGASLAAEYSKAIALQITAYIGSDAERFAELMRVFFGSEYRQSQRAAGVLTSGILNNPELIKPYLRTMVGLLGRPEVPPALTRNIVRILQEVEVPERLQGKLYSHCLDLLSDPRRPAATRAFALTVATRIARGHPGLRRELILIVNTYLPDGAVSFHIRAREVLSWQLQTNE